MYYALVKILIHVCTRLGECIIKYYKMEISQLPPELLQLIFKGLDTLYGWNSVHRLCLVNSEWRVNACNYIAAKLDLTLNGPGPSDEFELCSRYLRQDLKKMPSLRK